MPWQVCDGCWLLFTRRISPDSELFRLRLFDGVVHKVTRNSISDYDAAGAAALTSTFRIDAR